MTDTRIRLSRPWTATDHARLRELHEQGVSLLRVCTILKRRMASVQKHARELGLHFAGARELQRQARAREQSDT